MNLAIASDHEGFVLKNIIVEQYRHDPIYKFLDSGTFTSERTDYPRYAHAAMRLFVHGKVERVILLCGTGIGMSIVANRYPLVYAALVWSCEVARLSRQHNDSNVLVIPAEYISFSEALEMVSVWLDTPFFGGVYADRIGMIEHDSE